MRGHPQLHQRSNYGGVGPATLHHPCCPTPCPEVACSPRHYSRISRDGKEGLAFLWETKKNSQLLGLRHAWGYPAESWNTCARMITSNSNAPSLSPRVKILLIAHGFLFSSTHSLSAVGYVWGRIVGVPCSFHWKPQRFQPIILPSGPGSPCTKGQWKKTTIQTRRRPECSDAAIGGLGRTHSLCQPNLRVHPPSQCR